MIHVLFDIDETMVSLPKGLNSRASGLMFKKVFNVNTNEETVDNFSKTESWIIKATLDKIGVKIKKVPVTTYKVWAEETSKMLLNIKAKVLPGIPELLDNLSENKKIKLSFLTGNSPWRADAKLHQTKLCKYFVSSSQHKLRGIFGDISEERIDLLKTFLKKIDKNDKVIIIDDSLIGAMMSKVLGVPSILVATGKIPKSLLNKYSKNVFDDFGNNRWKRVVSIIENI
ncbi:MAG: hypothetical protein UR89_C0004G0021 [Candidatus Roizmanbacteria bacterium GW2011_GWA2_35_8]|uniref:Uncharacterized protein n=1 Tax=Candidatus Roizmanbacteria bacterium GW2011_GWA2_35_8 TaxID=1618479 RepID=A0A0G0G688_9BACT|nr:MAG: hypothetical protein UR89_C0004G0021 [Candidatus Roizmanbacteria bacterium GW2011_GWA2_35_8]